MTNLHVITLETEKEGRSSSLSDDEDDDDNDDGAAVDDISTPVSKVSVANAKPETNPSSSSRMVMEDTGNETNLNCYFFNL